MEKRGWGMQGFLQFIVPGDARSKDCGTCPGSWRQPAGERGRWSRIRQILPAAGQARAKEPRWQTGLGGFVWKRAKEA